LFGFYGISVVLSLIGLSVVWSQGRTLPVGIGALFLLAVLALRYFHFVRSWDDVVRKVDRLMTERRQVQYALLQAQILALELERCRDGREFWTLFDSTLHRVGFVKPAAGLVTMPIHVKHNGDEPWTLHRPCAAVLDETSHREWVRIAECFRPVYSRARVKWQS
jgi:hypothetical protein